MLEKSHPSFRLSTYKYKVISNGNTKLGETTYERNKNYISEILERYKKIRKVVLKHLDCQLKLYEVKDINIARHHFPHEYLTTQWSDNFRLASVILNRDKASLYGIGVLPDRVNLAVGSNKKDTMYFLAPVVTYEEMKQRIVCIKRSDRLEDRKSTAIRCVIHHVSSKSSSSREVSTTLAHQNDVSPTPNIVPPASVIKSKNSL